MSEKDLQKIAQDLENVLQEFGINGKIVKKPSDGRERLVSIGLGLFIK